MSSPSNLYAEKIFSEHPSVLWALDDTADYVSLISESNRNFDLWEISGGTSQTSTAATDRPFATSRLTTLTGDVPLGDAGQIVCTSPNIIGLKDLNASLSTFSIGGYINSISSYILSVEIGYEYDDATSGTVVQNLRRFDTSITNSWLFVSETFEIPNEDADARVVLKINYIAGSDIESDYTFLVNGITFGQWSEEFNSTSLGVSKQTLPTTINLPTSDVLPAAAYGLEESNGYYFIKDNALIAKNSGVPMVYGASNVTILSPNGNLPSLIVPGKGFLNKSGQYKEFTFECWLKIDSNSITPKRIVGPIGSSDGIYVNGPFISLKVDDHYGSHFVGEWYRPMLVQIKIVKDAISLILNGEQVVSLNVVTSTLNLPSEKSENGKDQDWIGFYSYEDVSPVEVDCIAIYPYQVPLIVAKKRWVYGQGVEFPENINTAYSGTSVYVDYPFADYTNNYSYPEIGRWNQGTIDNLSIQNNILSTPDYKLPTIFFDNKTESDFYSSLDQIQAESDLFFTMRPNSTWSDTNGYMYFDTLDFLTESTSAIYGVFKEKSTSDENQILIEIKDKSSSDSFQIKLGTGSIDYVLNYGGVESIFYRTQRYYAGEHFSVGISIQELSDYFGSNVAAFFGRRSFLSVYIAGNQDLDKTFTGNIYKIGFCTERNLSQVRSNFDSRGIIADSEVLELVGYDLFYNTDLQEDGHYGNSLPVADGMLYSTTYWANTYNPSFLNQLGQDILQPVSESTSSLIDHTASYTLIGKEYFGVFALDIAVNGYWEDYVPLTYFAQYVTNDKGDNYYDLDFIQFNINYPAPSIYVESETLSEWNYGESKTVTQNGQQVVLTSLLEEYRNPVQRKYTSLDNHLFTNYDNYDDLRYRSSKTYDYDTTSSLVNSYVTFQYISEGANRSLLYYSNTDPASKDGIVKPDSAWMNTKYEVVDSMLIYPPKGADFNDLALVTHLNFNIDGILNYKVGLRNLQLASQAFNESPNPIGTRFGTPIYPYVKSGIYFDYKQDNPYAIYKGSTPYLYLTRTSGIQLKGAYDPEINRGLSIPINSTKAENYKVMALQAALRYDKDFFPAAPTQVFEIESNNIFLKFFMVATDQNGQRAKLYAVNGNTGKIEDGIAFYWNGNIVKEPVLTVKQWGFLGISFSTLLDFRNNVGAIRINGPILINNISHYQSTNLQEVQKVAVRPWFKVKYDGPIDLDWNYWHPPYLWNGILVLSSTSYYGVEPDDIYKSFIGTNKIIVDDSSIFMFNKYQYNMYQDISWQQNSITAV